MTDITKTATMKVVVDASGVETGARKVEAAVDRVAAKVDKVGDKGGFTKVGAGATEAAGKVSIAERSLVGSIQRTTAAMEAGGKTSARYYEILAQQRGVDGSVLAPYLAQLRAVEATQAKANAALGAASPALAKVGVSAAQTAAALRGVPAQFTDIITSIQGGQAPLTVFLQQGGQLKDMFGGVGNAARALGGYVFGLINPFTVAAAAAVGLAVAYNAGSKEADAYARALISNGNAAGATADQLSDAARAVGAVSGSQREAAEVIAALAGTGKVGVANMREFASVTVEAQRVLGKSVKDTVSEFEALGKSPVEALGKINEKYNFITAATYAQVKALEDQGRVIEAANVAQMAYAEGVAGQRNKVLDTLSDWERGWLRIKKAANGAFDSTIDAAFGREATKQQQITELLKTRDAIENNIAIARGRRDTFAERRLTAQLEQNKVEINLIRSKQDAEKDAAKSDERKAAATQLRNKWLAESDILLSRTQKRDKEIDAARTRGLELGLKEEEIQNRLLVIRKKYEEAAKPATVKPSGSDAAMRKEAELLAELSGLTSSFADDWNALSSAYAKGKISVEQLTEAQAKLLAKQPAMRAEVEASARAEKQRTEFTTGYAKAVALMTEGQQKSITAANAEADKNEELARTYGMTKSAIEALELARLEEQLAQRSSLGLTLDEIDTLEKLISAKKRSAAALSSVDTQEATKQANKAMTDEWEKTVEKYEDVFRTGFADMLNKGKDGWKSFTTSLVTTFKTSVADQIYKMFAQPFVVKMVASLLGVTGGSTLSGAANAAGGTGEYVSIAQSAKATYDAITSGFETVSRSVANVTQRGINAATGANPTYGPMADGMATNGAFANAAGQFASTAAGYMAGAALNKAISGGYETGSGVMKVEKVATAVASYINPALGAVVGAISGVINRAFGMKERVYGDTTLNGAFGADGFAGTRDTPWTQKGGWFRSDKSDTDKTAIDAAMAQQFTIGYDAIKFASADFAQALGLNADAIKNRTQSLSIALTKDEDANKKAISDFFVGIGNTIAKELLPTISDFAKEGEGASATLQRLATNYATIDAALSGVSLTFGSIGVASLAARERLVTLSGGIEALVQNAAGFAQNYLTEAERLAPVASMVAKSMADLGFASIDTRDEFKALVQSLDLTTESGATNYAALMKLQGAFAEVAKASEVAADAAITNAKATAAAAIESAKASAAGLLTGVDDAFGVLQRVSNAEKDRLTKAHEVAMKRLQIGIDTETAAIAKTRALSDSIKSTISQISSGPDRATAQAQIQTAIAMAKAGGVLPSADSLKDALSVLSRDSGQFSTLQELQRDQYQTQNSLAELGKLTDSALSVEEKTLAALEAQKEAAQAAYEGEIGRLDEMVSAAQSQIDILKGIDTTGLSSLQALEALRTAILAAQGNSIGGSTSAITDAYKTALGRMPDAAGLAYFQDKVAGGAPVSDIVSGIKNSPEAQIKALYKEILGRGADAGGLDFFMKSGASAEAIRAALMNSDEYKKKIRGFAVGTNRVPYDMDARIHEDERIIPAADNRALMAMLSKPAGTNSELASAVGRLTAEVEGLRAEARATAVHTAKTAKLLDRVIKNDKISTEAA